MNKMYREAREGDNVIMFGSGIEHNTVATIARVSRDRKIITVKGGRKFYYIEGQEYYLTDGIAIRFPHRGEVEECEIKVKERKLRLEILQRLPKVKLEKLERIMEIIKEGKQ